MIDDAEHEPLPIALMNTARMDCVNASAIPSRAGTHDAEGPSVRSTPCRRLEPTGALPLCNQTLPDCRIACAYAFALCAGPAAVLMAKTLHEANSRLYICRRCSIRAELRTSR
jgi:hypothetical protein